MTKKQLKTLLWILAALSLLALILVWRDSASWQSRPEATKRTLLPKFDARAITKIIIANRDNRLELVKRNGLWFIPSANNYPADYPGLIALVAQLSEIRPLHALPSDKKQYSQLGLCEVSPGENPGLGVLLEFQDKKGQRLAALVLGKLHLQENETPSAFSQPIPSGRYALALDGKSQPVFISETLENIIPASFAWLRKDFFKIENPLSISFPPGKTTKALTLSRKSHVEPFVSEPAGRLDDAKLGQFLGTLASLSMNNVLPLESLPEIKKVAALQIKTVDGFEYQLRILNKNGKYYLWGETSAEIPQSVPKDSPLREKFKTERFLSAWAYEIPERAGQVLMNARSELPAKR
ncbi:MAG: hypothetical protein A2X49_01795 [Lentisphaerae bacterium GWF2_52_8]|nr:MAG: hypothetical protein A2X49_01795 [Lentisphaerae bacterium GWF2_52_8]